MLDKLILQVKNLSVSFGSTEIIKSLSFELKENENLVIIGPNGAGKTTLFKALLGLIPYKGEIIWHKDVKLGYLPSQGFLQDSKDLPLTVLDLFKLKDIPLDRIKYIIDKVGLTEGVLNKNFAKLSTGQFQRMLIAWTLVDDANVILFDEPISGIDISGQKVIYDLLHKFWKENNLSILMISHDLSVVWEHANRVLCLGSKRICFGKPHSVLTPKNLEEIYGTGIKFYEHKHN